MQQYLPFTVLKPTALSTSEPEKFPVATVLTVYGIETLPTLATLGSGPVATVLTVYGIETYGKLIPYRHYLPLQQYLPFTVLKRDNHKSQKKHALRVATVLTVYGIETKCYGANSTSLSIIQLQQYLPFTVLKPGTKFLSQMSPIATLQQYLPFTVLKPSMSSLTYPVKPLASCNSTYRLRY